MFSIKTRKEIVQVESRTHESALTKHLLERRHALLRVKDTAKADQLFSDFPRKAVVTGGGSSKSYRVRWEKMGTSRLAGSRYCFTVEESRLGGLLRRKVGA